MRPLGIFFEKKDFYTENILIFAAEKMNRRIRLVVQDIRFSV